MSFGRPEWAWAFALLPCLALWLRWGWLRRQKRLARFAEPELGARLRRGVDGRRYLFKSALTLGALALAVLAAMDPRWGYRWVSATGRGVDLVVALDISKSMLAGDESPDRLTRAKREVRDLLARLGEDRVGLLAFAASAQWVVPLTLDYPAVIRALDTLGPESITGGGTALGQAVARAVGTLGERARSSAVILLTDGEDLEGGVEAEVGRAKEAGLALHALGLGTPEGAPIPEPQGGFKKNEQGEMILTRLEEGRLREITAATGGSYVRAVPGDEDWDALLPAVRSRLEARGVAGGKRRVPVPRFQWPLFASLLLLLLEWAVGEGTRRAAFALLLSLGIPALGGVREGREAYERGDFREALRHFEEAHRRDPKDPRVRYNLGNTYYRLGRYGEAEAHFRETAPGLEREERGRAEYNGGNSAFRQGKLEEAVSRYETALKFLPEDPDVKHNLELARRLLRERPPPQPRKQAQASPPKPQPSPPQAEPKAQPRRTPDQKEAEGWLRRLKEGRREAKRNAAARGTSGRDW